MNSGVLGGCSDISDRSEEHTSELQSQSNLVCRLLLEKKKKKTQNIIFLHKYRHHIHNSRILTVQRHYVLLCAVVLYKCTLSSTYTLSSTICCTYSSS